MFSMQILRQKRQRKIQCGLLGIAGLVAGCSNDYDPDNGTFIFDKKESISASNEIDTSVRPAVEFPNRDELIFMNDGKEEVRIDFRWTEVVGAIDYKLYLSRPSQSPIFNFQSLQEITGFPVEHSTNEGIVRVSRSLPEGGYSFMVIAQLGEKLFSAWSESVRFQLVERSDAADYAPVFADVTRDVDPAKFHLTWASLPGGGSCAGRFRVGLLLAE